MTELTTGQRAVVGLMILGFVSTGLWGVLEYYSGPGSTASATVKYPAIAAEIMRRVDGDGDGRLSPAEYTLVGMEDVPFGRFDLDADGALSEAEVERSFLEESPSALLETHAPPGAPMGAEPGR